MHKCSYTQKFKIIRGKLTLCSTAHFKKLSLECYRRDLDKTVVRNMVYKAIAGYGVEFPGEKVRSWWYGDYTVSLEKWGNPGFKTAPWMGEHFPTIEEKELVEKCYPGMKWILAKADLTYKEILDIIPLWKKNPKVELLLAAGFWKLAFSKAFAKLKPSTQKKYLAIIKNIDPEDNPSLEYVRAISNGWTKELFDIAKNYAFHTFNNKHGKCTLEMAKYLQRTKVNAQEYVDYRKMVQNVGHDLTDPYWAFPSDFKKAHSKILRQQNTINRQQEAKKAAEIQEKYFKAVKKYVGKVMEKEGMRVYVPEFAADFGKHAKPLHQCLVYANYAEQVANGSKVLVFIQKEGKPYATAEIILSKRKLSVNQFYGDERLLDYKAKPDAVQAFNDWANEFNIKVTA